MNSGSSWGVIVAIYFIGVVATLVLFGRMDFVWPLDLVLNILAMFGIGYGVPMR